MEGLPGECSSLQRLGRKEGATAPSPGLILLSRPPLRQQSLGAAGPVGPCSRQHWHLVNHHPKTSECCEQLLSGKERLCPPLRSVLHFSSPQGRSYAPQHHETLAHTASHLFTPTPHLLTPAPHQPHTCSIPAHTCHRPAPHWLTSIPRLLIPDRHPFTANSHTCHTLVHTCPTPVQIGLVSRYTMNASEGPVLSCKLFCQRADTVVLELINEGACGSREPAPARAPRGLVVTKSFCSFLTVAPRC